MRRKTGENLICPICKKEFYCKLCDISKRKTCSIRCKAELFSGENNPYCRISQKFVGKNSPRWKIKKEIICPICRKIFLVKPSYQVKAKFCSRKCKAIWQEGQIPPNFGKEGLKLEQNPNWRGGLSFLPYSPKFNKLLKEKIREQFGRKCFECNQTEKDLGYKLRIHHLDYNKENCKENNLIPLCLSCHSQTNFDRQDWIKYFQDKLTVA